MRIYLTILLFCSSFLTLVQASPPISKESSELLGNWKPSGKGYSDMYLVFRSHDENIEMIAIYGAGARFYRRIKIACKADFCSISENDRQVCSIKRSAKDQFVMIEPPQISFKEKYGNKKSKKFEFVIKNTTFERTESINFELPD